MRTYPDGREVREGDVVRYFGEITRVTSLDGGLFPENVTTDRAKGNGAGGLWTTKTDEITLLRRRGEFKVGDEVRNKLGWECYVSGVMERSCRLAIRGGGERRDLSENLTLLRPVEDIEGGECKECGDVGKHSPFCESGMKPSWLARAERKEFREGDVCVRTEGGKVFSAGHVFTVEHVGPTTLRDTDDPIYDPKDGLRWCHAPNKTSLLRPVDWVPQVGDRVTQFQDNGGNFRTFTLRGGVVGIFKKWRDDYAPAELAEPLIPLLRGDGEYNGRTGNACSSNISMGAERGIQLPEVPVTPAPCPRCGEPMEGDKCNSTCGFDRNALPTTMDVMKFPNSDRPGALGSMCVNGDGRTLREIQRTNEHNERWTSVYYTPRHCPRCGRSGGCMCKRPE